MKTTAFGIVLALAMALEVAQAGIVAVGLCYTACNASYVTCMGASGLVAGVAGPAAVSAAMACR